MASPGDKKGQRRGVCGHIMASFDLHKRCARCRDKGIGDDDCVAKRSCVIMSTPLGGGHIIFAFSAVCLPASGVPLGFQTF